MTPEELTRAVADATLPPESFDHRAHIMFAWHLVSTRGLPEAMAAYRDGIRGYCTAYGITGKYHETMTFALLVLIAERVENTPGGWSAFERANPDLFDDWRGLLGRHYREEELESPRARERFVLPRRAG